MHTNTTPPLTDDDAHRATDDPELAAHRTAVTELGTELRALVESCVRTTASSKRLHHLAQQVRALREDLREPVRERSRIPAVDRFPQGPRMYSPASGEGSPLAPPMRVVPTQDGLQGTCTLGIAHEGPPGFAHGGMSAMLLDDLMGWTCTAAGVPSMTISLNTRYLRPVPLQTPLRLLARIAASKDRKITVEGSISTEAAPDTTLVSAEALFLEPDPEQARALFPDMQ